MSNLTELTFFKNLPIGKIGNDNPYNDDDAFLYLYLGHQYGTSEKLGVFSILGIFAQSNDSTMESYGNMSASDAIMVIKGIFNKNPENLYISKEDFDKLMEIWAEIGRNEDEINYDSKPYSSSPESIDFIRSITAPPEYQLFQDNFNIFKMEEWVKSEEEELERKNDFVANLKSDLEDLRDAKKNTLGLLKNVSTPSV